MKALLVAISLALALAGCACKGGNCKPCPPCPVNPAGDQWCMPVPEQPKVPCHVSVDLWVGELGRFERFFVPAMCDPDCVNSEGVMYPGCQR